MTVVKIMNRTPLQSISSDLDDRAAKNSHRLKCINHQDSSCIDPDMSLKSIKKKINFSWFSGAVTLLFGAGFSILDRIGDIRLALQLYLSAIKDGNYNNSSSVAIQNINKEAEPYIITNYQLFLVCFAFIITIGFYRSLKSIAKYWTELNEITVKKLRKQKEKSDFYEKLTYWKSFRDPKSWWTVGRLVFHLLLLAPAARAIELVHLGSKTDFIYKENDTSKMRKHFEEIKSNHRKLTSIQHVQNCFESGPLLWLKMHLLSLDIISGKVLMSYGFWNLFFIGVGIASCAWKVMFNRKNTNLINDCEKRLSWFDDITPIFIAHFLSVCVRFSLFGMLSAGSLKGFEIFCVVHIFIVLHTITITSVEGGISFFNPENVCDNWNNCLEIWMKGIFHIWHVLLASLFTFPNFDEDNYRTLRTIIYFLVPTGENMLLFVLTNYSGVSYELAVCLCVFFITSYLIMSHSTENLFQLSSVAFTSPSTINPIVPHENRRNNDVDSTPNEKMPYPTLITLQSTDTLAQEESV